jgi:glutathione S-transferase
MTPILFYGIPAGCSFGSIVALEWIGRPYRLCRIPMPELVTSDAYRRINPLAETPACITASGKVLTESMAILNHAGAEALDTGLAFRQGTDGYDQLNRMLAYLNTTFFDAFSTLWYAYEHGSEGTEKEVLQALGRKRVTKAHGDVEAMLQGRKWLLGDGRTLADAYFSGLARWADYHDVLDIRDFPRIAELRRRLAEDEGVLFAQAVEEGSETAASSAFQGHVTLDDAVKLAAR